MGYYSEVRFATTKKGYEKIKELAPRYFRELGGDPNYKMEVGIVLAKSGDYVMFGWDDVKWVGYNHKERVAYERAFEECGEFVKYVGVGEDGAIDEQIWGEEDYDMPWVEPISKLDYSAEWEEIEN